ncbi:putative RNA-directed DNA polymerase [Helianthus annuus]|nr:putative RNA-directed DNA polymerase [Helianthus annuus]
MQGRRFTCSRENGRKLSKIDRVLVSADFFNKWPNACLRAHPCSFSDHCPLSLEVVDSNFGPRPFRIFSSWIGQAGFEEAVLDAVGGGDPNDPPDLALTKKFFRIRKRLKIWREDFLAKEKEDVKQACEDLENLEEALEVRELSEEEEWILTESKKMVKNFEDRKNADLKQRSRVRWAIDGDENSKFFHALINKRKATNFIPGLMINGEWCTKPALIKREVLSFFRNKFVEDFKVRPSLCCDVFKSLSQPSKDSLVVPFSKEEIKCAVFGCGDERAPGPDGVNFNFLKKFWHLFEDDFHNIFNRFYEDGNLNCGCSSSFICLVPKISDPVSLGNFRPINLVGVISKVVSKVLANRLRMVLEEVISDSQSAFIEGKFILDGPLIVNEVLSWLKKEKMKAFILKIDFEKAYDNVNWNFVISVLNQMGFPPRWNCWVLGILKSARSSVLVNGSPTFEFICGKGMRQGDPLSPFLFLIVMEALSCMLGKARREGAINGIRLPRSGPVLSHLFYADDAIILGDWSQSEVTNVVRILRCFYICSGLKINMSKSNLYGVGVSGGEVDGMASIVGCRPDSLPFTYLGLLVGANMNRINNWKPVFDIFEKRLATWKSSLLSIGGRVTVIKSVLESLPTYYFSLYKAPKKVINDLECIIKKFLWGGSSSGRKMHWVGWDRVALDKRKGGLGICKLGDTNVALLAKWGWRFKTEPMNLWRKVVGSIHWSRVSWECIPFKSSYGGVWSNIAKIFVKTKVNGLPLRNCIKGIVGEGDAISFWLDPWLTDAPLRVIFPAIFLLESNKKCMVRDRVDVHDPERLCRWEWKRIPSSEQELIDIQQINSMVRGTVFQPGIDRWCWIPDKKGKFSVSNIKKLLKFDMDVSSRFIMHWCKWVPSKCSIFAWRAEMGSIPTVAALKNRNIQIEDLSCTMCNSAEETVDHIFTSCSVAVRLWELIRNWCNTPPFMVFAFRDLLEWYDYSGLSGCAKEAFEGIIIVACWSLWKSRNEARFANKPVKAENIFSQVKAISFLWFVNRSRHKDILWDDWCNFVNM